MGDSLLARLWNWGRYCRANPDRPDDSCQNSFWDQIVSTDDDGYGEVTETTVIAQQVAVLDPAPEVDEIDAERMDFMVWQLERTQRVVLARRFVLRHKVGHTYVDAAIAALERLMEANREVIANMRKRGVR